jgi:hypothetical protein
VTLYTKALFASTDPKDLKQRTPDEVLRFKEQAGVLRAVDYDRGRWQGADLSLTRQDPSGPGATSD